jgi:hypothetical protein
MKKLIAAAVAATALVGALAINTSDAEARRYHRGFGIGLGLGLLGAGIAYSAPHYYEPDVTCEWVERYDRRGRYLGTRKICRVIPY